MSAKILKFPVGRCRPSKDFEHSRKAPVPSEVKGVIGAIKPGVKSSSAVVYPKPSSGEGSYANLPSDCNPD